MGLSEVRFRTSSSVFDACAVKFVLTAARSCHVRVTALHEPHNRLDKSVLSECLLPCYKLKYFCLLAGHTSSCCHSCPHLLSLPKDKRYHLLREGIPYPHPSSSDISSTFSFAPFELKYTSHFYLFSSDCSINFLTIIS